VTPGDAAISPTTTYTPATLAFDIRAEADTLVDGLLAEPWGQVSPSVYETGRLVSLVPWLTGHDARTRYLLEAQRADGTWGPQEPGYALVPTLSATEALLSEARQRAEVADAAANGLRALCRWGGRAGALTAADLPDLPAIELIVPCLIDSINDRLDAGVVPWPDTGRLRPPEGLTGTALAAVRAVLASGQAPPRKLMHVLEVGGDAARRHRAVRPEVTGTIGASPAATAAWLGGPQVDTAGAPARRFLETVGTRQGGPVPCGLPITVFERAWVLSGLLRAGIRMDLPPILVASLSAAVGPTGTAAAAGLPVDADTTAGALYALALAGAPRPPDPLWAFETESHFCTWPGEDGVSVTTNAHVLEAFGQYVRSLGVDDGSAARYAATSAKVSAWLRDVQRDDGSWQDRWHVSPYYATVCAALALHDFGGPESADAVDRAVRWVVETQRTDGSWGRWTGTAEETAYAVQILLLARERRPHPDPRLDAACLRAAARGCDHLRRSPIGPDHPPLWHDKDLYLPVSIAHSARLAALAVYERLPPSPCQGSS
jgi:halimadienyl-diphosphate synthase